MGKRRSFVWEKVFLRKDQKVFLWKTGRSSYRKQIGFLKKGYRQENHLIEHHPVEDIEAFKPYILR